MRKHCRSGRILQNEHLLENIGFDAAKNEPSKIQRNVANFNLLTFAKFGKVTPNCNTTRGHGALSPCLEPDGNLAAPGSLCTKKRRETSANKFEQILGKNAANLEFLSAAKLCSPRIQRAAWRSAVPCASVLGAAA